MFYSLIPSSYPKMEARKKHENEKTIFRIRTALYVIGRMQDWLFHIFKWQHRQHRRIKSEL